MAFWGCEVKPGKATPFVPPPEGSKLHLSQACLSTKAKPGAKAALRVRVSGEGEQLLVCSLREGGSESIGLDLIFDQYTEFSVEGSAAIHLTGYYMPEYEMGEEDSDDEGGYPAGQVLGYDENGVPVLAGEYDSEEDSDYESEEGEEDEEFDSDDGEDLNPPRRIVIEDVTESEKVRREVEALPAPEHANGGRAAAFEDGDVDASDDDDDDEDSEEAEVGQEPEGDDSEDEEQQQPAAGQKRKAEQPPAKQPAKQQKVKGQQQAAQQPKQEAAVATPAAKQQQQQKVQKEAAPASTAKSKVRTFPNGFEIEDLKMGRPDGKLAKAGKKVVMRYVGRLKSNGKVFDQTKGNATFAFRLGVGEVIKGWDRGVEGMRVGDKRKLTIPPAMAYGTSGVRGAIPPNAHLVFEVELVDVK